VTGARRTAWAGGVAALVLSSCMSPGAADDEARFARERERLVARDLRGEGIRDERVLAAIGAVKRHEFVPLELRAQAYVDRPLPIGDGQTISQPYVVALMSERLAVRPGDKVLEVGTGSGYQAAVLAQLGCRVFSVEILPELADSARQRLHRLGYDVAVRAGDGYFGWPEEAPFDGIIITAATPQVPEALVGQLREGGRIVLPLGGDDGQRLVVGTRTATGLKLEDVGGVAFVPMTGEVRRK